MQPGLYHLCLLEGGPSFSPGENRPSPEKQLQSSYRSCQLQSQLLSPKRTQALGGTLDPEGTDPNSGNSNAAMPEAVTIGSRALAGAMGMGLKQLPDNPQ